MCLFFTESQVGGFAEAVTTDTDAFNDYFVKMLGDGVYIAPSAFDALYLSSAHTEADIDRTVEVARKSLKR
jgi:glutamate-1-semialdehyde 2,1-aminomutase